MRFKAKAAAALVLATVTGLNSVARAGDTVIGTISTSTTVSGIAFDDVDPLHRPIIASADGTFSRISLTDASIVQTYSTPINNTIRGLVYAGNGEYFQTRNQPNQLYTVNPVSGTATAAPSTLGSAYNFLDIARDPTSGNLWMVTDTNQGSLYQIDPTTGQQTLVQTFSGLNQAVSLAIGPDGAIYVSNSSGFTTVDDSIYQLDPSTGALTLKTTLDFAAPDFLRDFKYDPYDNQWYGVVEQRSDTPRSWSLVQISGLPVVPEPATMGASLLAVGFCLRRGARRP